jgi:hypothetical protein
VPEERERERVARSRRTSAAIRDHVFRTEDLAEQGAELRQRTVALRRAIDDAPRGDVLRAGNVAGPAVLVDLAAVAPSTERADDDRARVADRGEHVALAHDEPFARARDERRLAVRARLAADWTALARPRRPAAVEDPDLVETKRAQHPEEARGPHVLTRVVEDDARAGADAEPSHLLREPIGLGPGERESRGVRVRELEQVRERSARHVRFTPPLATARDLEIRRDLHGHVEDAQFRFSDVVGEPRGIDEALHASCGAFGVPQNLTFSCQSRGIRSRS